MRGVETEVPEDEERDPTEAIRVVIMIIGVALNVVIVWDYLKDRPDVMIARQRLKNLWTKHVTNPEKRARDLRRAEGETVFEAINIVESS